MDEFLRHADRTAGAWPKLKIKPKITIQKPPIPSMVKLLDSEADQKGGALYVDTRPAFSEIRYPDETWRTVTTKREISLSQDFRIEFETSSSAGYTAALQHAPGGWGWVSTSFDCNAGIIRLPGLNTDGDPDWMAEEDEAGSHQFIAAQGSKPFPPEVCGTEVCGGPIDRAVVVKFARNYLKQDQETRRLFVMNLTIL